MFMYLLATGKSEKWEGLGNEPVVSIDWYPGYLVGNTILFHSREFTNEEFAVLCEDALREYVDGFIEHELLKFGKRMLKHGKTDVHPDVKKEELSAAIYNGLVRKHGFFAVPKAAQLNIISDARVQLDPTEEIQTPYSETIISKFKVWFNTAMKTRRDKALSNADQ